MLYRASGGEKAVDVPEPAPPEANAGIYHPRADRPFASLAEYLTWYQAQALVPPGAPLVGILFYSNNYKFGDLAHIRALVERLEREQIGAVPVFGWPLESLRPYLTVEGRSPLRALMAFSLGFTQTQDVTELERYGVPVMNLLVTRESAAEWDASSNGIAPDRISTQLNSPERAGANEPILVATSEQVQGSSTSRTQAVPERVDAAVQRVKRWLVLQEKPNKDKRVAFIYYSNPPGKGYLGASYLNLMPSLINVVRRLRAEGYQTGSDAVDEAYLAGLLERSGRNVEEWAPEELEQMAQRGTALVSIATYKRWFAELPSEFRESVLRVWGRPEQSALMTVTGRDGRKSFVVPGIRLGNLFLGPQPLRSTYDRAVQSQHDTLTPPPHSYIAAYLWYRHEFQADAVVHMASLPLDVNIQFITVMATKMPFVGRG